MVCLATDHHAIDVLEVGRHLVIADDAAIDQDLQARKLLLQLVRHLIAQRRNLTVFFRAQALQDRIARVDDKRAATRLGHPADKIPNEIVVLDLVDADPMLDGDRDIHRIAHRLDAVGHQLRLGHQAGAEGAALHALGRAAAVQVDFRIAPLLAQLRRHGEVDRLAAAQLQCHRVFCRVEVQVAGHVAMQQRTGGHHLGVQPGVAAELAVEHAAMAVGPVHHGSDRNAAGIYVHGIRLLAWRRDQEGPLETGAHGVGIWRSRHPVAGDCTSGEAAGPRKSESIATASRIAAPRPGSLSAAQSARSSWQKPSGICLENPWSTHW